VIVVPSGFNADCCVAVCVGMTLRVSVDADLLLQMLLHHLLFDYQRV
jgi:hypothetical protein